MAYEQFRIFKPSMSIKISYKDNLGEKNIYHKNQKELLSQIKEITESYLIDQNIKLTNRQLYYQLVSSDIIPNADEIYSRSNSLLTDARYGGEIDWESLEDRSRIVKIPPEWESVKDLISCATSQYRLPRWSDQEYYIEIYCEKQALESVIYPIAKKYHLPFGYNKGYNSAASMYELSKRLSSKIKNGKKIILLYLGDHDPSGLDMIRDIRERITEFLTKGEVNIFEKFNTYDKEFDAKCKELCGKCDFTETCKGSVYESITDCAVNKVLDSEIQGTTLARRQESIAEIFNVIPLALTKDQINQYNPPPNPAKITDPRAKWYLAKHGKTSWELDALKPEVLIDIVEQGILRFLDTDKYNKWIDLEEEHKKSLINFSEKIE